MSTQRIVDIPGRLALANLPTPLRLLSRYSARFPSTRVWVKHDEMTGTEWSGNKVRKLEFTLAEAKARGCDTLITCGGLQSNHCRAVAILGARLGFAVHLLLRGEPPEQIDGNLLLGHLAGASIHYLAASHWSQHEAHAARLQAALERQGRQVMFIPTGASDAIGLWGYALASEELARDFRQHALQPDAIVVATGSGGTQAGLIVGAHAFGLTARVLAMAVCDNASWFAEKVRRDISDWQQRYQHCLAGGGDWSSLPVNTIDAYIGPGYGVADAAVHALIGELARTEGVLLDPVYTGKAFYGLQCEIEQGCLREASDVVFIHTGGIFGLFPQRDALIAVNPVVSEVVKQKFR